MHQPEIGIVPIGDRFTMNAHTAALACKRYFDFKTVIPCHYGTFPIIDQTPDAFLAEMKGENVVVPTPGEAFRGLGGMAGLGPDRPLGPAVDPLPPGLSPQRRAFEGRHVRLEPLAAARHAEELFASFAETDPDGQIWDYMGQGPWTDFDVFATWLEQCETSEDPLFFVIRPQTTGRAAGMATYLRTDVANGVTEIGNIWFFTRIAAHPCGQRGDFPDDAPCVRGCRCAAA